MEINFKSFRQSESSAAVRHIPPRGVPPPVASQFALTEMSGVLFLRQVGDTRTGNFDPLAFVLLCFVQWQVKNTPKETEIFYNY